MNDKGIKRDGGEISDRLGYNIVDSTVRTSDSYANNKNLRMAKNEMNNLKASIQVSLTDRDIWGWLKKADVIAIRQLSTMKIHRKPKTS